MDKKVVVYSSETCHFCKDLKKFLEDNNVEFDDKDVANENNRNELIEKSGQLGVPVTFIGEEMIVGFEEDKLKELLGI